MMMMMMCMNVNNESMDCPHKYGGSDTEGSTEDNTI